MFVVPKVTPSKGAELNVGVKSIGAVD